MRYVRHPDIRPKAVGDAVAVFVPATGAVHVLNPTAELLLAALEEPAGLDELAATLAARTDGDRRTIEGDLEATLAEFCALQLVATVE